RLSFPTRRSSDLGSRGSPFHTSHAGNFSQSHDILYAHGIVAQVEHQWQTVSGVSHTTHIFQHAAWSSERVGRLVHHNGINAGSGCCARKAASLAHAAAHAVNDWNAAIDLLHHSFHHLLGLAGLKGIELACIAIDHQEVDLGIHSSLDDG